MKVTISKYQVIFSSIVFIVLIGLVVFLFLKNLEYKEVVNNINKAFSMYTNDLYLKEMESEDIVFSPSLSNDSEMNEFIKEFQNGPVLCYYFEENSTCQACIEQIAYIIESFKQKSNWNVVYLSNYNSPRNAFFFKTANQLSSNVYNVKSLNIKAEELDGPLCFVIDEGIIRNIYTPIKDEIASLNKYLELINIKY